MSFFLMQTHLKDDCRKSQLIFFLSVVHSKRASFHLFKYAWCSHIPLQHIRPVLNKITAYHNLSGHQHRLFSKCYCALFPLFGFPGRVYSTVKSYDKDFFVGGPGIPPCCAGGPSASVSRQEGQAGGVLISDSRGCSSQLAHDNIKLGTLLCVIWLWQRSCVARLILTLYGYFGRPGLRSISKTFANVSLKTHYFRRTLANVSLSWTRPRSVNGWCGGHSCVKQSHQFDLEIDFWACCVQWESKVLTRRTLQREKSV